MNLPNEHERRRWLAWAASGLVALNLPSLVGCGGGDDSSTGGSAGTSPMPPDPPSPPSPPIAPPPPPPPPLTGSSPDSVQAAQATQAALITLTALAAGTPVFDAAAVASALSLSGAFARTGVGADSRTAWGRTAAGRWLVVALDVRRPIAAGPGPMGSTGRVRPLARRHDGRARASTQTANAASAGFSSARSAAAAPGRAVALAGGTELPRLLVARQMRLLDMLGPIARQTWPHLVSHDVGARTLPDLRAIAAGRGFELVPDTPDAAFEFGRETTVEGLKAVRGDGVFFVNSFGGSASDAADAGGALASVSAIATTTRGVVRGSDGSSTADPAFEADLAAGRLVQMIVPDLRSDTPAWRAVLGITPDFARFHDWQFEPNSLAWLNVSGGGIVGAWQGVLGARGAQTLVGWSQGVPMAQMLAVAEDFFHLTLATDAFEGPLADTLRRTPRLRNYGNGETLEFLASLGLDDLAELAYFPQANPAEYVNTLTPTLDYALINEEDETCELVGQFGAERDGSVLLATGLNSFSEPLLARATDPPVRFGDALRIEIWRGDFARVQLPRHLQGGYLQLRNDGRWTNVVQLSFWEMPITVRATLTGGLMFDITLRLRLRGDIRGYRLRPDQPPLEQQPGVLLSRMLGSSAQWTASGAIERTEGDTTRRIEWSGSSLVTAAVAADGAVVVNGNLDLGTRRMRTQLLVSAPGWRERTVVTREGRVQSDETVVKTLAVAFPLRSLEGLTLAFDDRWNITAGSASDSETVTLLGDRVREVVVSWPGAAAAFAPEDNVGGR